MKVKAVAEVVGISADSVRFYTREQLLKPGKNPNNGYRTYSVSDVSRLKFIVRARWLGFSLEDIRTLLDQADRGQTPCPMARALIERRLVETENKLVELQALCHRMRSATQLWQQMADCEPGEPICHLISVFETSDQFIAQQFSSGPVLEAVNSGESLQSVGVNHVKV